MIPYERMGRYEQIFSFSDHDSGEVFHFAAERLAAYLDGIEHETFGATLTPGWVKHMVENGGVEPDHVKRVEERIKAVGMMVRPVVLARRANGTHICVDGAHRIVAAWNLGGEGIPAYDVPERLWRRFLVEGMPGELDRWHEVLADTQIGNMPFGAAAIPAL